MTWRLATRSVDARSIGFLVAGASSITAQQMLAAIREQPPVAGTRDTAASWVAAIHSHNGGRGREFALRHGIIHVGTELESLLQRPEIQCVYVGNHPRHHAETVQAALAAHKHVLCEPPLALVKEEAEALVQLARNRGLVLAMNYTWRATAAIHQIMDLLVSDSIGELLGGRVCNTAYLAVEKQTWRLQPNGGGVIWNRTLHDVDLLRFLLRLPVREVYGRRGGSTLASEVEDEILGHAVMTGGVLIQLHDSFIQPHLPVIVEFYGTRGALTATACTPADKSTEVLLRRGDSVRSIEVPAVNTFRASVANFLAAIRGLAEPLAPGAEDLHNIAAAIAMQRSLAMRTAVRC